ncbi:Serine--tRNA ligase [Candidatus Hepatoplasma crinochetorum Av]|uniref:Serine--tRNA ligase n=1 Tax=Candidatus Hepatoplasma crinochetorum Av TaxID=1427984 RepID=W8GFZ0_9MOLU|nr:serine--tRNA ligase [Candidatus Hepatoplasma crinochetorum]AHK22699.1 Serine--tRNA ligase [Candidatus Hepatoplasma crinochetorum Av]
MFNLKELANNKDFYLKMFERKGYFLAKEFTNFLFYYDDYKKTLIIDENDRNKLNDLSKKIPKNPNLKLEAKKLSSKIKKNSENKRNLFEKVINIVSSFPNIPFDDIPIGKNEKDNKIILEKKVKNHKTNEIFHLDILKQKKLILEEEAIFISGRRHVIYQDKAAQVIFALERLMLDFSIQKSYKMIDSPLIVNEKVLYNTAQLPKFKDDLFELKNKQFLIPTAEVPLTNLVANKIVDQKQLPLKYCSFTNCFRKEVASAGKDTKGIIRLHQFRKVEIVKIGKKVDLENDFKEMIDLIKELLDQFDISYRLVNLCTGDLSFASKKTIDFEIWFPGQKRYREISSLSIIGDFQARRMNARFIDDKTKEKEYLYTYNGSALAIDRLFAAIVENYYQKDQSILIPKVLQKYLPFNKF